MSIEEKAKKIRDIIEQKKQDEQKAVQDNRVTDLQHEHNQITSINRARTQKYNEDQERIREIEESIKGGLVDRNTIKTEGKNALSEIKQVEGGVDAIRESKEYRDEIWGDAIIALKSIKETIISKKAELRLIKQRMEEERNDAQSVRQGMIQEFRKNYPEINQIHKKLSYLHDAKNFLESQKNEINSFLGKAENKPFIDDALAYRNDSYGRKRIFDITLEDKIQTLQKRLDEFRANINIKKNKIATEEEKGKGFFESRQAFEDKIKKLREEVRVEETAGEYEIIHGNEGSSALRNAQNRIQKELETILRVNFNSETKEIEIMEKVKTIRDFLELTKEKIEKELQEKKLPEDEQLIVDINSELWRA